VITRLRPQRVVDGDRTARILGSDAVEEQVHGAQPGGVVDDLPAAERVIAQVVRLVGVEMDIAREVVVRGEEEPAGAAGGVADGHARLRLHHLDHGLDERARREVLARAGLDVFGVLLEEPLVGVPLHVGVEGHPLLAVDEVDDEPAQLGGVLDPVLCLAEDDAEHAVAAAELVEDLDVLGLELVTVPIQE